MEWVSSICMCVRMHYHCNALVSAAGKGAGENFAVVETFFINLQPEPENVPLNLKMALLRRCYSHTLQPRLAYVYQM